MKDVKLYTDGACSGNPGIGGWGVILQYGEHSREAQGAVGPETTNQRMELTAVISGLTLLTEPCNVTVYSDSAYVVNAFQKGWIDNWRNNGWKTSKGEPVKNPDLWQKLYELEQAQALVIWVKVKGHSDNEFNNRADALATGAIKAVKGE